MNLNPLDLWHSLQHLPPAIATVVFASLLFMFCAFVILPLGMMLRTEPGQLAIWWKAQRERMPRVDGAERLLRTTILALESVNVAVGYFFAWLALSMALMQFVVVIMRYVFAFGSIPMQESIWYMHGLLFMLGAGYTYLKDGHVRVDIFYRSAGVRAKAWVDLLGTLFMLLPLCVFTWWAAWGYVVNAWEIREGSIEASGLPYIYLFKTVILAFVVLLGVQALATISRSLLVLLGFERERADESLSGRED
ncbi:MAG: TRAP transporter small permease subunit [Gammaproteobacteria bacterium]